MTDLLSEDELAGLKALRELAETLPPYDWQWTTLTGENGPYQSHEDMIEGIAKTIRHSESLGLHAITWNDEDVDGRSSVVCTTGNGPTSPLHAQYIAAVKPSNILRLLSHIDALKAERDGLKEECAKLAEAVQFPEASKCLPTPRRGFELAQMKIAAAIRAKGQL